MSAAVITRRAIPLWLVVRKGLLPFAYQSYRNGKASGRWPWVIQHANRLWIDLDELLSWVRATGNPVHFDAVALFALAVEMDAEAARS